MKNIILICLSALFVLASCKKDNEGDKSSAYGSLNVDGKTYVIHNAEAEYNKNDKYHPLVFNMDNNTSNIFYFVLYIPLPDISESIGKSFSGSKIYSDISITDDSGDFDGGYISGTVKLTTLNVGKKTLKVEFVDCVYETYITKKRKTMNGTITFDYVENNY